MTCFEDSLILQSEILCSLPIFTESTTATKQIFIGGKIESLSIIRTLGYNFFPDILLKPLKSILVIYCCINYVKFSGLNNRHLLSHCLCESLRGFCRVGLQLMKTWLGLENLLPSWLTHMAVGRKSLFLAIWASPQRFLHDMAVGFPQSEWSQKEKNTSEFRWKKGRDARLKVTFSKFWSLVSHCHSRC